jgi:hypothetical protein
MPKGQFVTTVALHACPTALQARIEALFNDLGLSLSWAKQGLVAGHDSAEVTLRIGEEQAIELASNIYALGAIYFDMNQRQGKFGLLFMGVPGLGVFRGELNESGSILLSEDRINQMVELSSGNHREFMRLLRVSLGQSWDDIMEPFRGAKYSNNVVLLNRAG